MQWEKDNSLWIYSLICFDHFLQNLGVPHRFVASFVLHSALSYSRANPKEIRRTPPVRPCKKKELQNCADDISFPFFLIFPPILSIYII